MKYLIFGTLAFLLFLFQTTQAQQWEELTYGEVDLSNDSSIIEDLLLVAVGYVNQKGKFESTKAPIPGYHYSLDDESVKYERRTTSTRTYYRYNFLLTETDGPSAVNATVTISYNPSNSNFIVTNYNYKIDYNANDGQNEQSTVDSSEEKFTLIDTRTLTGDGDLAKTLSEAFDDLVSQKISNGNLAESNYEIAHIYRAYSTQSDGVEDVNEEGEINEEAEDSHGYKDYYIWVKFKSSEGDYYLMMVFIQYDKDNETGEVGSEISSLAGFQQLDWVEKTA